ncbi:MAG: HD domain-containing protein [Rikenellaceae bacterium]
MIRGEIVEYVEREILPRYCAFDKAHGVDHAQTVIDESLSLSAYYPEVDVEMAYLIAAYHDLGLCDGRERHHIVSGEILRADVFVAERFSAEQIGIMAEAIEDHRASAKGDPRTIYGRIVAEADRVISPEVTLRRTVQYGLRENPDATRDQHFARFCDHLQDKYAEGGYLKLYIAHGKNAERLEELRAVIGDERELRRRFEQIFEDENY